MPLVVHPFTPRFSPPEASHWHTQIGGLAAHDGVLAVSLARPEMPAPRVPPGLRAPRARPARAGLREAVANVQPNALEVRIDPEFAAPVKGSRTEAADAVSRTPGQLFADYCASVAVADAKVAALYSELHEEVTAETAS